MRDSTRSCSIGAGLLCLGLLLPRPAAATWPADPLVNVPLCTAAGNQADPASAPDGTGGAIITWADSRGTYFDVYARQISADGTPQWTADGVPLCTASYSQTEPTIVADGAGGAVVAWCDPRASTSNTDIYAQGVTPDGELGSLVGLPEQTGFALALDPVRPNPVRGGPLAVRFTLPGAAAASLELFDVAGRRIATREVGALGVGRHTLELRESAGLAPGLYLVRLTRGPDAQVTRVVVLK
jgi:hypothetical protein